MHRSNLVYVAPSPIHGKGLFAQSRIGGGTYIGTYEGRPAKADGCYVLWVYEDDERVIGRDGTNDLRYLNHSDEPNAEFDGFDLYSLRSIAPHEEITINYSAA